LKAFQKALDTNMELNLESIDPVAEGDKDFLIIMIDGKIYKNPLITE